MDEQAQKSCWGLTVKAAIGFAALIFVAWLFTGAETVAMVASN